MAARLRSRRANRSRWPRAGFECGFGHIGGQWRAVNGARRQRVVHRCPRGHSVSDSGSESFALLRHVTGPDISIQHPDWHSAIRLYGSPFLAVNKH